MDIRNLIYERVRLVRQGRLVWFLFLETNIGEAFAPLAHCKLDLCLGKCLKDYRLTYLYYIDTINCILTIF